MKKIKQLLDDEHMEKSLDALIQDGIDLDKRIRDERLEQEAAKLQMEWSKRETAVRLAREFLPMALRPFLRFDRMVEKKFDEYGWSQWWNVAMVLEPPDLAPLELRFYGVNLFGNDDEAEMIIETGRGDPPIAVMDYTAVLDEFGDDGWIPSRRIMESFDDLRLALKMASEIGDRSEQVAKDCDQKNRMLRAKRESIPDPDPEIKKAPKFQDLFIEAMRGIIRAEIRAENEPF